jgi:hypothetical protein
MLTLLGYFLCLAVLTPALSLEVFFCVLSKMPRPHDVLAVFSMLLQLLATVTSPVRITLTLTLFLCAYLARQTITALSPSPALWYGDGI